MAPEQIEEMKKRGIEFWISAGRRLFLGAASSIGAEYTVPEAPSQSLIITGWLAGRLCQIGNPKAMHSTDLYAPSSCPFKASKGSSAS